MKRILPVFMILGLSALFCVVLYQDFFLPRILYLSSTDTHIFIIPKNHDKFSKIYHFVVGVESRCVGREVVVMPWDLGHKTLSLHDQLILSKQEIDAALDAALQHMNSNK